MLDDFVQDPNADKIFDEFTFLEKSTISKKKFD